MPSFRALSLFFTASLAAFSFAAPAYTAPTDVSTGGKPTTEVVPLVTVVAGLKADLEPVIAELDAVAVVKVDTVTDITAKITAVIDVATVKAKALVGADLDVILAADVHGGARVTVDVLVEAIVSVVLSVVACIKVAIGLAVKAELALVIKLFVSILVSLCAFLQVCVSLVVELAVALTLKLSVFIALCLELGVKADVFAFLHL